MRLASRLGDGTLELLRDVSAAITRLATQRHVSQADA
jgi:hypothetical protein